MTRVCYLCGKAIAAGEASEDHVVPKQLIQRPQPKVKGFKYAGVLPSHKKCNNEFGPEVYSPKAFALIRALHDENCFLERQHRNNPAVVVMTLNANCLSGFSKRDLMFFKIIDVRDKDYSEWSSPSFFKNKPKINALEHALFTALAVLSKSAAALLVSCHLTVVPSRWRIIAIPYFGEGNAVDFDALLGDTKPFDVGVKVWLRPMENGDWFAIYKVRDVVVYLLFWFSADDVHLEGIRRIFGDADRFLFDSASLTELIDYQWKKV